MCLCSFLSTVLTAVEMVSHKGINSNEDVPSECHQASNVIAKGLASEEKVIFVLELLGSILPAHFYRFHKRNISTVETKAIREPLLVH